MSNFASNDNMTALFTATGTKLGERAKIFPGTKAEWDALPLSEKVKYDYVAFAGDSQSGIVDDVPTEDSENLVKSGGVFDAIKPVSDDVDDISDEIADMNNVLGAKNIVPNVAKTQTVNGITYTANSDGSITINGTATGWAQSYVIQGLLHKGTYKISIGTALPTKVWATLRNVDTSSSILNLGNGSSTVERSFTLSSDTNVGLFCGIEGGITVNNLTVYPMIRPASITDDTYVPYSRTNQELTGEVEPMLNVLGAKNLLPNNAVSKTVNGITFTVNSNGSIGISSTNSETSGSYSVSDEFLLKKGSYKLSRGKHSTPCPSLYIAKASDFSLIAELTTDSSTEEISFTLDADVKVKCWMWYIANNAYNTTFYPMLRLASIQDDTYVPYSMTNREMTPYVQAISNPNLLDNPWFTVNQRGQSSYVWDTDIGYRYTVDRWQAYKPNIQVTSDGVVYAYAGGTEPGSNFSVLRQFIEDYSYLAGKTVTLSTIVNGTLYKATGVFPSAAGDPSISIVLGTGITMYVAFQTGQNYPKVSITNYSTTSITIRAIKLELGSVSTLAMDTAPNYATELLKCQRYYERLYVFQHNILSASASYDRDYYVMPKRTQGSLKVYSAIGTANKIGLYINDQWEDADYVDISWNTSILNTNIRFSVTVPANSYFKGHIEVSADL